jgi:hypothetical protein
MKQKLLRKSRVLLLTLIFSCSADEVLEIFVPNISNLWFSDRNSTFTLTPAQQNVNEGSFTGVESDDNTGDDYNLSGSFKNYDISFTFASGPESGRTYSGQFVKDANPQRMNLRRNDDATKTLVLRQN